MDHLEHTNPELNLDDIMEEYGSEKSEDVQLPVEEQIPEEDITVVDKEAAQTQEPASVSEDTVRLNDITAVLKQKSEDMGNTIAFTPVGEQETAKEPAYIPPQQPEKEPYSQEWEPEYEQPMGEYVPAEPLIYRPKSRLRELKKKLIAGPEKRYYELTELGFGKIQAAIFFCALVAILSVFTALMYAGGLVPEERMRLLVFSQLLGLLIAAMFGSYQLMEGVSDLFKGHFSLNTLLVFSFIACVADGVFCLQAVRVPCCAPFSLNMTMSLWSTYHKRMTELGQMDTMRKAVRLNSIVLEEEYYEGMPGILRGEGQVEDFMDSYRTKSGAERVLQIYALVALFVSIGIGVTAGVLSGLEIGIRFFSASLLIAIPATAHIAVSRPMAILERKLHKVGTVLCGWQGIKALNTRAVFPVNGEDLFPAGSVKLNGLKFYGSRNPDQVVAYCTAVIVANGGGLAPLFSHMLESRNGYHYEVETLRHYPNGGVGGVVNGEAVLVGNASFMEEMGIKIPDATRMTQAVYVAVDNVLNGVFALSYNKMKTAALGLTTLCGYRDVKTAVVSEDFMLTPDFLHGKFGINPKRVQFVDWKTQQELAAREPSENGEVVALTTQEGLASSAFAVTGAHAVRSAATAGVTVQMMGGILGLLIMIALAVVHAEDLLTPENLLLYELAWMIPGLLITAWARHV